jgi:site-specific recombinase XerD
VIENLRDHAFIFTLLRTGMLIGELLNIKLIDIYLFEKRIDSIEITRRYARLTENTRKDKYF